jgi:hypothetical protein
MALYEMKSTPFLNEGNIPFHPDIPLPRMGTLTFSLPAMAYEAYLQSEYIHGDFARVKPIEMLEMILSETHTGAEVLKEWVPVFALRHGIDCEKVRAKGRKRKLSRRISALRGMLSNLGMRYRIDKSHRLPINDVFEASLVAATLLSTRPSLARNYPHTMRRLAEKFDVKGLVRRATDKSTAGQEK